MNPEYVDGLPGDSECRAALSWIAHRVTRYPSGGFTPPLRRTNKGEKAKKFASLSVRLGRKGLRASGAKVTRMDTNDGAATSSHVTMSGDQRQEAMKSLFCTATSGTMYVTTGVRRHVLDVWLESFGQVLVDMGYTLQPCVSGGSVSWLKVKKGHRSWTITYFETMTGVAPSVGLQLAQAAKGLSPSLQPSAAYMYHAIDAVSSFYRSEFGCALKPTAGMIAMKCARRFLPRGEWKWRPAPLLVAMERIGFGYRGGMAYATRYSGPTWRIDVNRQYTNALRYPMPLRAAFGPYEGPERTPHGTFVCRVQLSDRVQYPLGVWLGSENGFEFRQCGAGSYVCILHTSEFPGLRTAGAIIEPWYGYVYTATFDLGEYVERLQAIVDREGKGSPLGRLTKPLGNYVYGKLGQRPDRVEIAYAADRPGDDWHPYVDNEGKDWVGIWEQNVTRYSASQHVDIAASLTGYARSQTVSTWALLSALGVQVVRCHTDSLTLSLDPSPYICSSDSEIGSWRVETTEDQSIIIGPNAYFDEKGAHIAGVTEPTYEMIERLYDGQVVAVSQTMQTPRRGFARGVQMTERKYKASG